MYLKRIIEKTFKKAMNQFSAIVIYGPRQVGKSTMALFNLDAKVKKVTLDNDVDLAHARMNPDSFLNTYHWPTFIDEAQKAPELSNAIKMRIDEQKLIWLKENRKNELMYVLSGSNQFELRSHAADTLSGRICILRMNSLSYPEKMQVEAFKPFTPEIKTLLEREKNCPLKPLSKEEIFSLIIEGGMPEYITQKRDRHLFFSSYIDTFLYKDISKSIQSKNLSVFRLFLQYVALRTGQELNKENIANAIGISVKTVDNWLDILEKAGIIIKLQPYMSNISNRIIKTPKIYFMDTGLCSYLCGWHDASQLEKSAMSGAFYETYVVSEIIKSLDGEGIKWDEHLFYYRDIDQKEIDLLYVERDAITPIEIKKSVIPTKPNKNFSVLDKYHMNIKPGLIIDSASKITPINEKVYIYPIHLLGA